MSVLSKFISPDSVSMAETDMDEKKPSAQKTKRFDPVDNSESQLRVNPNTDTFSRSATTKQSRSPGMEHSNLMFNQNKDETPLQRKDVDLTNLNIDINMQELLSDQIKEESKSKSGSRLI